MLRETSSEYGKIADAGRRGSDLQKQFRKLPSLKLSARSLGASLVSRFSEPRPLQQIQAPAAIAIFMVMWDGKMSAISAMRKVEL